MKNHALFSSKDKSKKIKMSSAQIFVWPFKGKVFYVMVKALSGKLSCKVQVLLF